jgi:hypothetical protein
MLHLNVWLRTPYIVALANRIKAADMHRVSASIGRTSHARKHDSDNGARQDHVPYVARNAHDWNVPACFIAVLLGWYAALIGQWGAHTTAATKRQTSVYSCIPVVNLVQLLAANDGVKLACPFRIRSRTSRINNPKGTFMKYAIVLKVAAVAVVAGLAGCQDLKPLQSDVADLKSQVAKLQSDVAAAKSSADQANSTAQSASQAASGAQSTANQALAAAQASQSAVDATNEKIDRMFKRSISK